MVDSPARKKNWVLSKEAFDNLLISLDANPKRATDKFELVQKKLIFFFESNHCFAAQDCTDITITRVARKLMENSEIRIDNNHGYFFGVADNVLHEYWKSERNILPLTDLKNDNYLSVNPFEEQARKEEMMELEKKSDCFEECLKKLSVEKRAFIIRYYEGERQVKIGNRQAMAKELGIPMNALRIRALRIREKLVECMRECFGEAPEE